MRPAYDYAVLKLKLGGDFKPGDGVQLNDAEYPLVADSLFLMRHIPEASADPAAGQPTRADIVVILAGNTQLDEPVSPKMALWDRAHLFEVMSDVQQPDWKVAVDLECQAGPLPLDYRHLGILS
jgi:hypothetical protein